MRSSAPAFTPNICHAARISLLILLIASSGCSPTANAGPTPISGSSQTLVVSGQYAPVALDRVDRLSVDAGQLVLHGPSGNVTVPLPSVAGKPKPGEQWMLITESKADDKRSLTFTHEQSLDDFTITVPAGDADLRYGTLSGTSGDDVLVFAWGRASRSYWGWVTIAHGPGVGAHP